MPYEIEEILEKLQRDLFWSTFLDKIVDPIRISLLRFAKYSNEFNIAFYKFERPRKDGYIDILRKQEPYIHAYPTFIMYDYGIAFGKCWLRIQNI